MKYEREIKLGITLEEANKYLEHLPLNIDIADSIYLEKYCKKVEDICLIKLMDLM